MRNLILVALLLVMVTSACRKPLSAPKNKFEDIVFVRIKDFQDRRLTDSLYPYLSNENVAYRLDAVLAFASIQDSTAVDKIAKLLADGAVEIRKAAAFALGQTSCLRSESILLDASRKEIQKQVLREILESYGKVARNWNLEIKPDDSLVQNGLAWSIYRSGLSGHDNSTLNGKAAMLLNPTFDESTMLGAAHYFARSAKGIEQFQQIIISTAKHSVSDEIRMASTLALRKIKTDTSRLAAQHILQHDKDYRVRINAIRALQSFPFHQTKEILFSALKDENVNVGIAASEAIKSTSTKEHWQDLLALARAAKNWRIQANLYEGALSVSGQKQLVEEVRTVYNEVADPYHKAALITALQHSILSYGFVQEQLFNSNVPVIKSASASTLVAMNYRKDFEPSLKIPFAALYAKAVSTGDPGVISSITTALGDSTLAYEKEIKNFSFLYEAKKKLSLPKDNEAIQPLEAAIAYFEGKKLPASLKNNFNHPIEWRLVKEIRHDQQATIITTKGNITIQLFVEDAPGSVANFVDLANQHYFDNKFFHRVVPNFVVQGGCNRGDGFGSEDYSIRSEFLQRRYKTGSLGMASSGKDTEGTQWFITHSPTPHLDGRYTIFAEVINGMEVVDRIEVGDKILKIELNK